MMHDSDGWSQIAASSFVSLGTYRRSGTLVATPVWIAPDGDDLVVTTDRDSGKVKRLRVDERVTLQPCNAGGRVAPDAVTVEATARLDGDAAAGNSALASKYGVQMRLVLGFERFAQRLGRKRRDRVIIRIS